MTTLTHLDATGAARMVDVSAKPATRRQATATGRIAMTPATAAAIRAGDLPKGDVLGTARLAGIMAAKQTASLIPLCHPLAIDAVDVTLDCGEDHVTVTATVATTGRTGVEMEALTAATVALLAVYDMAKALQKDMVIEQVRLIAKSGGRSGDWQAA